MSAEQRIEELALTLPASPKSAGTYVPGVQVGSLLFMSGCGPLRPDGTFVVGKLGADLDVAQGYAAARLTGLVMLARLRAVLGSLDRVQRVVKVLGMVNATPEFGEQPEVINGCSDLFVTVFGDRGRHARSAVGMGSLPRGIPVEIEVIVEVNAGPARGSASAAARKSAVRTKRKSAKAKRR